MEFNQGIGYEKACRLSNTNHSEVAPALPLPSLPVSFGAADARIELLDEPSHGARLGDRPDVLSHAGAIAELLRNCDVSYL